MKGKGSGWHGEIVRHSNAKRIGRAGPAYKYPRRIRKRNIMRIFRRPMKYKPRPIIISPTISLINVKL